MILYICNKDGFIVFRFFIPYIYFLIKIVYLFTLLQIWFETYVTNILRNNSLNKLLLLLLVFNYA